MPSLENPFTPVFGQVPLHMAGRGEVISEIREALDSCGGNPSLTSHIVGARGTGKTALLSLLGSQAESNGWIAVNATSLPGILENIFEQTVKRSSHLITKNEGFAITGITVGGFGVEWNRAEGSVRGTWRTRMENLLDALSAVDAGLLICVDEINPDLPEMAELVATYQHFVRENRRVALLMAGIPSHVLNLLSRKESAFLRRACQYRIGRVPDVEIGEAFESTVSDGGKAIDGKALDLAVEVIDGFPFMMQLLGYRCWKAASAEECITEEAVRKAARRAEQDLRERVYDTVYHELSQGDRDFLAAMLTDEGPSALADLRERLGKSPQQLSYQKKRLIGQGLVRDEMRGFVSFDMPGFRRYLKDQLG